jgi:hypothetical protein
MLEINLNALWFLVRLCLLAAAEPNLSFSSISSRIASKSLHFRFSFDVENDVVGTNEEWSGAKFAVAFKYCKDQSIYHMCTFSDLVQLYELFHRHYLHPLNILSEEIFEKNPLPRVKSRRQLANAFMFYYDRIVKANTSFPLARLVKFVDAQHNTLDFYANEHKNYQKECNFTGAGNVLGRIYDTNKFRCMCEYPLKEWNSISRKCEHLKRTEASDHRWLRLMSTCASKNFCGAGKCIDEAASAYGYRCECENGYQADPRLFYPNCERKRPTELCAKSEYDCNSGVCVVVRLNGTKQYKW